MKLSELFTELSYIEFANLSLSNEASGKIRDVDQSRLITSTNEALLELYKRFMLLEKELLIETQTWRTHYPLRKAHARTDTTPNVSKYIIDTDEHPFIGDLIHVTGVRDSSGCELPLNDAHQCNSVYTPAVDIVQLSQCEHAALYFITYKASHPNLLYDANNLTTTMDQELFVPLALKTALREKIASNLFSAMSGQEFSAQAQALGMKFETSCAMVETQNLVGPREMALNYKLEQRGFC